MNFKDQSFNMEKAPNYQCFVQVDRIGLSYCVFDTEEKRHVAFKKIRFDQLEPRQDLVQGLESMLSSDPVFRLPFQSAGLVFYSQQSTLVPDSYFEKQYRDDYLLFNQSHEATDEVYCNYVYPVRAWNVFAVPWAISSVVSRLMPQVKFFHQATPFLCQSLGGKAQSSDHRVFVGLNMDFFDVAVVQNNRLLLYNSFQYVNETDLLYFVLYVYKQMKLDYGDVPLVLSGELTSERKYPDTLKEYIPAVSNAEASDGFILSPGLFSIPVYQYLNILSLYQCASSEENTKEEE